MIKIVLSQLNPKKKKIIYALLIKDGQSYLNTVERFDPIVNQWFTDVAPTATRTSVGVAVLDSYLYAVRTLI